MKLSENLILKKSLSAGIIGFFSWLFLFIVFDPFAGLYKIGKFDIDFVLLRNFKLYLYCLLVGIIFFLFFYIILRFREKYKLVNIVMWLWIIMYALFYLGYVFLLFFFRF